MILQQRGRDVHGGAAAVAVAVEFLKKKFSFLL
jgi:hypothetical protein